MSILYGFTPGLADLLQPSSYSGKTFGIVGVIITSQATVGGLSEQRDEAVSDVSTGAAFLEVVAGDMGEA